MRDVMLADYDLDVDTEVVGMAEYFDDTADCVFALFREFQDLDVDDHAVEVAGGRDRNRRHADPVAIAGFGRDLHAFGNVDPLANAVVMRDDVRSTLAGAEIRRPRLDGRGGGS